MDIARQPSKYIALVRFSPAWFIFLLGLIALSAALLVVCFISGEYMAMQLLSFGGTPL